MRRKIHYQTAKQGTLQRFRKWRICWTAPLFNLHRDNSQKREMKHWFERSFAIWEWAPFLIPAHVAVIPTLSILLQRFAVNSIDYIGTWVIQTSERFAELFATPEYVQISSNGPKYGSLVQYARRGNDREHIVLLTSRAKWSSTR